MPKGSEKDIDLAKRLEADGMLATYPILETQEGDLLT